MGSNFNVWAYEPDLSFHDQSAKVIFVEKLLRNYQYLISWTFMPEDFKRRMIFFFSNGHANCLLWRQLIVYSVCVWADTKQILIADNRWKVWREYPKLCEYSVKFFFFFPTKLVIFGCSITNRIWLCQIKILC